MPHINQVCYRKDGYFYCSFVYNIELGLKLGFTWQHLHNHIESRLMSLPRVSRLHVAEPAEAHWMDAPMMLGPCPEEMVEKLEGEQSWASLCSSLGGSLTGDRRPLKLDPCSLAIPAPQLCGGRRGEQVLVQGWLSED